jgi:ribosomal protein S27AE
VIVKTAKAETLHKINDGDLRFKMCQCSRCGQVSRCTPINDFYGDTGDPLICERCFMKEHGIKTIVHLNPEDPQN